MKLTRAPCNLALMNLALPVCQPFSLTRSIEFIRGFCAISDDYELTPTSITAAVWRDGAGHWFRLSGDREVTLELSPRAPESVARLAARFVGAHEDLAPFYAAAEGDPPMRARVRALYGLHHVRFLTLAEIAVYCVMMQRNPVTRAAALKRKFLAAFGHPVITPTGEVLRAMPELAMLATLDGVAIGTAIGHRPKGMAIAKVVAGVVRLGEEFLATAPYAVARDALLTIDGIGPFSAAAILLRGLGRMDELPSFDLFEQPARALYGAAYDPAAITRRYGASIGYWAYYLKAGKFAPTPPRKAQAR